MLWMNYRDLLCQKHGWQQQVTSSNFLLLSEATFGLFQVGNDSKSETHKTSFHERMDSSVLIATVEASPQDECREQSLCFLVGYSSLLSPHGIPVPEPEPLWLMCLISPCMPRFKKNKNDLDLLCDQRDVRDRTTQWTTPQILTHPRTSHPTQINHVPQEHHISFSAVHPTHSGPPTELKPSSSSPASPPPSSPYPSTTSKAFPFTPSLSVSKRMASTV